MQVGRLSSKHATQELCRHAVPDRRSLERVGEWWSMLILRDAFAGVTRFDEFQQSLGIAPNMLARRLAALVDAGMLGGAATASGRRATNTS
jgi:Predicted transcriptional regulators